MARAVRFDLIADASKFTRGMRDAQRSTQQFSQHTSRAGSAIKGLFAAFSVGVVVSEMRDWVAAARDANKVAAQTDTVIRSTHGAAGLTAQGFADLAKQISSTAAVDDDLIQGGENIIATFTQIHGDVFKKTTQAAVDMAAAMNHGEVTQQGLQSASIQLGKALNDPVKGLSALQRVGVTFSEQQKQQIANFVKAGQTAKAQGVILAEVNKEFGGSAAAAATPAKQLAVTWGNMQEVLGNLLIPAIDRGAKILNALLGVVDRNRTAFGVLFGVLGTGAAVIGTLVVAEKIHAAITDSIKVATTVWSTAQKGLNVVLGVTKVQAAAAATATEAQAAATTAAGTAAQGAAAKMGASGLLGRVGGLAGGLLRLSPLLITVGVGLEAIRERSDSATQAADRLQRNTDRLIDSAIKNGTVNQVVAQQAKANAKETAEQGLQTAYAAKQAELQRQEMIRLVPQYQTAADKARLNADEIKKLSGSLKQARGELTQNRQSMAQTIESYDGLISKSKVTASQVVRDLRNQVANFRTYAKDAQTLIRRGVDPAAIRELSQKGPEYVHALATGSNRQLGIYKQYWHDRQETIKSSFAAAMDKQYQNLVRKIRDMQREINKLKGKTIQITARTDVQITKSVRQYLAASNVPGFHAKGALIPGYGGGDVYPAMLEPGEAVVPKEKARLPDFRAWAKAMGIPGFQFGGLVGRYYHPTVAETRRIGISEGRVAAAVLSQLMALPGGGGGGGSALAQKVAQWTATVLGRAMESGAWFRRLMFESGGNPRAINRSDSNWFAGHPSVGIAQVIRGTFQAFAGRYRGVGPFAYGVSMDPYANSYAGGHYAVGRYGSLAAVDPRVRPMGYDRGGWLPPGASVAVNTTGRPEPVGPHVTNLYVDRRLLARIVNDGGLQNARLA